MAGCQPSFLMVPGLGISTRYTYIVLQRIQMKLILLCVLAEPAVLGSTKTALKFKYIRFEMANTHTIQCKGQGTSLKVKEKTHDLNHNSTFSAHTIDCVCHSIRSMFRVHGISMICQPTTDKIKTMGNCFG